MFLIHILLIDIHIEIRTLTVALKEEVLVPCTLSKEMCK